MDEIITPPKIKNKHTHQTKGCPATVPGRMPRKTKPAPIVTVQTVQPVKTEAPEPSAPDSTESQAAESQSAENQEENSAVTVDLTRRPRKKLRRPTLSDTIPAIPVASFGRMVRHMAEEYKSDLRWEGEALEALQVDAEAFLIQRFQKAKETMEIFGRKSGGKQLRELIRA